MEKIKSLKKFQSNDRQNKMKENSSELIFYGAQGLLLAVLWGLYIVYGTELGKPNSKKVP